jgi:hypothetical protein
MKATPPIGLKERSDAYAAVVDVFGGTSGPVSEGIPSSGMRGGNPIEIVPSNRNSRTPAALHL